jgi:predicted aspartyl protease
MSVEMIIRWHPASTVYPRLIFLRKQLTCPLLGTDGLCFMRLLTVVLGRALWLAPLSLATSLSLGVCAAHGEDSGKCLLVHVADLPLNEREGRLITTVTVNGHALSMMRDTGSIVTTIKMSSAKAAGLQPGASGQARVIGVGGRSTLLLSHAKTIDLGEAHGASLTVAVGRDDGTSDGIDGLLGMDYLGDMDVDLDLPGHRLGLYRTSGDCRSPVAALDPPIYDVALQQGRHEYKPSVDVIINGQHVRAALDTGANTIVFRDTAQRIGLLGGDLRRDFDLHGIGPHKIATQLAVSAPIDIGDLTFSKMPVQIVDQNHLPETEMLLGHEFVSYVHVWISHSSRSLIMQFPPRPSPPVGVAPAGAGGQANAQ